MVYFPSQIVKFLNSKYPCPEHTASLACDQAATMSYLLTMINNIPSRVLTLPDHSLFEFGQAVEDVRTAVDRWSNASREYLLKASVDGEPHPLAVIRKHLLTLNDEGFDSSTPDLVFVSDPKLRQELRQDITSINDALRDGGWKAATVLAGSVVEALLLDALIAFRNASPSNASQIDATVVAEKLGRKNKASGLDKWTLFPLVRVAANIGVIGDSTGKQCEIMCGFRNLIHPGKAKRLSQVCDRGTALSAVAAVEHVARDLAKFSMEK